MDMSPDDREPDGGANKCGLCEKGNPAGDRPQTPRRDFPGQAVILDLLNKIEALGEHQNMLA